MKRQTAAIHSKAANAKFFAVLLAAGLSLGTTTTAQAQVDQGTLAVPAFSLTFAPIYVAEGKGYWKELGLDLKLPLIPGIGATNAVLAGSVDFASTSAASHTRAVARGQKLVAIANTLEMVQLELVISKALADKMKISSSTPLNQRGQALKGARIAVDAPNTIVHGYVRYAAKMAGLNPDRDVNVSPMQPPAMLQALKSGQIDGFSMSRPWTSTARRDLGAVTLVSNQGGDLPELNPFNYNVIVTRPGVCEDKPTLCRKVLAGLTKAVTLMHQQPAEALAVLAKRFDKIEPDLLKEGFAGVLAGTPRTIEVKEAGFTNAENYMVGADQIKPGERLPSYAGIYNNTWVK